MGSLSPWHWLIVLLVILVLFGSKKLPDAARGLGRSMRIFKSEIKEMQNDDNPAQESQPQQLPAAGQNNTAQYVQPTGYPQQQAQPAVAPHAGQPQGSAAVQQPYQQQPPQQAAQQPYPAPVEQPYQQPGTVDPQQQHR